MIRAGNCGQENCWFRQNSNLCLLSFLYLLCISLSTMHFFIYYAFLCLLRISSSTTHFFVYYAFLCLQCISLSTMHFFVFYAFLCLLCISLSTTHFFIYYAFLYLLLCCINFYVLNKYYHFHINPPLEQKKVITLHLRLLFLIIIKTDFWHTIINTKNNLN